MHVDDVELKSDSIVTIFKTDIKTVELMEKIGIKINFTRVMDDTTILLTPDQLAILKQEAPYLISMAVTDLTRLDEGEFRVNNKKALSIPSPTTEPVIGVIDTMFDEGVYFSEWVEFKNMLSKEIPLSRDDYNHGTAVSSIIVDGPAFNPQLDDGCGRFKVRHFGVATGSQFSSFTILRNINEIVSNNKDIRVWNLSLGSKVEINPNFIS
ncbi:MAG TPA: serine protease, partial [Saprospirales bacterium]|nr:serine protease [Saprospirales bacterium]